MNPRTSLPNWVNVAAYRQVGPATELQIFLKREGLEARVQDERGLQRYWFWTTPQAGIHVQVPGASYEQARKCLEANPQTQALIKKAIHCPSCNSPRVQYPQMTHKFILPTLVAQVMVLLRIMKPECYCEDCHWTWALPATALPGLPVPKTP